MSASPMRSPVMPASDAHYLLTALVAAAPQQVTAARLVGARLGATPDTWELAALVARFSDDTVRVDSAVHNAARIWKLCGTVAVKGDATPDRPSPRSRCSSARAATCCAAPF